MPRPVDDDAAAQFIADETTVLDQRVVEEDLVAIADLAVLADIDQLERAELDVEAEYRGAAVGRGRARRSGGGRAGRRVGEHGSLRSDKSSWLAGAAGSRAQDVVERVPGRPQHFLYLAGEPHQHGALRGGGQRSRWPVSWRSAR